MKRMRLKDCTRLRAVGRRVAVGLSALALGCTMSPGIARADGDPASDVLSTGTLFLPQDGGLSPDQQAQLTDLLAEAARGGLPLRVAVIASPTDLGSIPELWRQPANYAGYLGEELSEIYSGLLLVVMPNGYSVYRARGPDSAERAAVAGLPSPGSALGPAVIDAVRRIAAAGGHSLALPSAGVSSPAAAPDVAAWLVFAAGIAAVALAWGLSLRARPVGRRHVGHSPS